MDWASVEVLQLQGWAKLSELRRANPRLKVVFTNGCFDLLHPGHIHLLNRCKELGDILVVGLNADESVRRLKGHPRPIYPLHHRMMMLEAMRAVDIVIPFYDDTPAEVIEAIGPDVLVKGSDYAVQDIAGAQYVVQRGGTVITLDLLGGISTSVALEKCGREPDRLAACPQ